MAPRHCSWCGNGHRRRSASSSLLPAPAVLALTALAANCSSAFLGLRLRTSRGLSSAGVPARAGSRIARPASDPSSLPDTWKAGPAEVYSGQAQKALYLMKENPILFESTVEEELEALQRQKEQEELQKDALETTDKQDTLVLRRRMEEVRGNERIRIVQELLYLKVCHKFKQLQVPLIPTMKAGGSVRFGNVDLKALTTDIYSKDALELVRDHLFQIVGKQGQMPMAVVQIALFQAGQVYAMSALFGYYLRRVDARFQLEKLASSFGVDGEETPGENPFAKDEDTKKSLKDYIAGFGPEQVQSMTSVASVEAQMAMESQVTALFGDLRILKEKLFNALGMVSSNEEASQKLQEAIQKDEVESLRIIGDDLRRMVLEAVAYGALLNDAEKQVDSLYELTPAASRSMGALTGEDDGGRMLPE